MADPERTEFRDAFPSTQWTEVIAVVQRGDIAAVAGALEEFCQSYRPAIVYFFRRRGCSNEEAEDFTQEFFVTRVLEPQTELAGFLQTAERRAGGRFRSFLCHVLWRFLQDKWKSARTARKGGALPHLPWEEWALAEEPHNAAAYEQFGHEFDREFAWQILERAARRSPNSQQVLSHLRGEISQQQAADELGLSVPAFKQAYYRFRVRLAGDLWAEVSRLVGPDEDEIRAEIQHLISLFDRPPA